MPTTLLPSTTTVSISPSLSSITPSSVVTITITVAGNGTITPTGTVQFALGNLLGSASAYKLTPASNATATAVLVLRAADLPGGPNVFNVTYSGDSHYVPSAANAPAIPNDPTDFALATTTPILAIQSGATSSATYTLGSLNGFNALVGITCTAPAALSCTSTVSSYFLPAAGNIAGTVSINTVTATSVSGSNSIQPPLWKGVAAPVFAAFLLCCIPNRKRIGRILFALVFCAALGAVTGCSHSQHTTAEPVITYSNAAPGTYNVVITGTAANGIVHNQNITIVVQ